MVDLAPPAWPPAFSASFVESSEMFPNVSNAGRWFYDWENRQSKFEHLAGQRNLFCSCADKTTTAACHLYFPPSGALWAYFPAATPGRGNCCRVCEPGQGCSTLRPTWLVDNSTFLGAERHDGLDCLAWAKDGAVATDVWSQTAEGRACQYREYFSAGPPPGIWHYLNFTSWNASLPEATTFELPAHCQDTCPQTFPSCA